MPLSEKRMNHPRFWAFNNTAGDMLAAALKRHGMEMTDIDNGLEGAAGRVVDDLTSLLIRAHDNREKRKA